MAGRSGDKAGCKWGREPLSAGTFAEVSAVLAATHVGGKDNVLSGTVWLEVKQGPHIRPWTQQFTLIVE